MRKILIMALLAATAATPALAQGGGRGHLGERRIAVEENDSPQVRGERPARAHERQAPGRIEAMPPSRQVIGERGDDDRGWRQQRREGRRDWRAGRFEGRFEDRQDRIEDRRDDDQNWRDRHREDDRRWTDFDRRWDRDRGYNRWSWRDRHWDRWDHRKWRSDPRYDWRHHREYFRHLYHLPRYYAPYGWRSGYRRYWIGIYLNSLLFSARYWIDDPWYYRLPPAYGPYRWIRYYDDVLLVDLRTGYVVDVIYDFFW